MKKLNLLFQMSTLTSLMVAGLFTFAWAQSADDQAKKQKLTVDIEVIENGKVTKITKEIDANEGENIHDILKDLDVMDDLDITGKGERLEIKVKKEIAGDTDRDIDIQVMGDDDDFEWIGAEADMKPRPLLGVFISSYDQDGQKGALVNDIVEGSAAEAAELKENDVIIAIDQTAITSEKQLREEIAGRAIGDEVTVKYLRDGQEATKKVKLGESKDENVFMQRMAPNGGNRFFFKGDFDDEELQEQLEKMEKDMHFNFDFEMDDDGAFLGVTPSDKVENGVKLGKVVEGSAAEKMGLQSGDVVTKLDGQNVTTFEELADIVTKKKAGDPINVEYTRDGKSQAVSGELGKREVHQFRKRVMRMAPDGDMNAMDRFAPNVTKEVKVVIELKDCTKEEEQMLAQPASVDFAKELSVNKIEFAPNPNNGQFNLNFELPEKKDTRIMVFDQMGRKVYEELISNFNGNYRNQIDISTQPNGVYFLIIAQQDKQFTRKIVKQ